MGSSDCEWQQHEDSGHFKLSEVEIRALRSPSPLYIEELEPKVPAYHSGVNYYEQYWELYLENERLMKQLSGGSLDRDDLLQKIIHIESFYEENIDKMRGERYLHNGRKKHVRRCANDIQREFICPYEQCAKLYGSEGSLNLHIKIKHNGGNKTDREKFAKSIVFAKASGVTLVPELVG